MPSEPDVHRILAEIDLDIKNLLRDGKLSALRYVVGGPGGRAVDRGSNLRALLQARRHYERQLELETPDAE